MSSVSPSMKRTRPESPSTDDAKAPEKRPRESVLSPPSLSTSKTTNGFFKDSGLKPSDDYGKKLLELAEKQQKDKKPIELQDPAKAHAPVNSFKNEKENETSTDEKKQSEPEKETPAAVTSKPIFGTFGKNLTSKAAENGNGDSSQETTEVTKKDASTKEVNPLANPWSSALKKNGGFGGGGLGSGFGFKKTSDSGDKNPFKKLGDQTTSFGKSVFAQPSSKPVVTEEKKEDVKTGEEEETNCLNITTARLFKFDKSEKQYKERGRGTLRMNDKGSGSDFSSRLVFRTAGTQRVALNTQIWGGMSVEKCTPKSIRISAQDSSESEGDALSVGVFLIQCGQDQANELFKALDGRISQGNMITSVRFMSPNPVTIQEVADRVNYVLSTFDKIDTEKLNLDCRFDKDLGLDSLDTTEVALYIEREFAMEITVEQMDTLLPPPANEYHVYPANNPYHVYHPYIRPTLAEQRQYSDTMLQMSGENFTVMDQHEFISSVHPSSIDEINRISASFQQPMQPPPPVQRQIQQQQQQAPVEIQQQQQQQQQPTSSSMVMPGSGETDEKPSIEEINKQTIENFRSRVTTQRFWCKIAYHELQDRVGETWEAPSEIESIVIDGYANPFDGAPNRFSLGLITNINRRPEADRTRRFIGRGISLLYEDGCLWLLNESDSAVFIQSPICNITKNWHPATVVKVVSQSNIKLFERERFEDVLCAKFRSGYEETYNLVYVCKIRMSFVKGWGAAYSRATVSQCPCWIEISLNEPLAWLDAALRELKEPSKRHNQLVLNFLSLFRSTQHFDRGEKDDRISFDATDSPLIT